MNPKRCLVKILICVLFCWKAGFAHAQFNYANNNQGVEFVPFGGSFTYSVSWTNGAYSNSGMTGTWVYSFYKPSGVITINALYPSTGYFSYTVPSVTSSDDGSYYLSLSSTNSNSIQTSFVYMHVTPGILQQPTNTTVTNGQTTTMGLVAGPTTSTYAWINATTGNTFATGNSFTANPSLNGQWIYCKISNSYGYVITSPVLLSVPASTFNYSNNGPGVVFVPYGGSFTYSVSWTNGTYSFGGTIGTYVNSFFKPSGSININALYPSTGGFSYTIPFVTSSDDGPYYLYLSAGSSYPDTIPVYMHVTPAILQQPANTIILAGQTTSMGLIAGPNTATYTWIDASSGNTVASGSTFVATTGMDGKQVYCKISNSYGYVITSIATIHIGSLAPAITSQPTNEMVVEGQSATFSTTAAGTAPLAYSWYHNGYLIPGANLNFITIASTTNDDAGIYSCVVSNSYGSVTSSNALLSLVIDSPSPSVSIATGSDGLHVQFAGTSDYSYTLQSTTNLTPPINWQTVCTNYIYTNGDCQFLDTNMNCPQKFYRVVGNNLGQ